MKMWGPFVKSYEDFQNSGSKALNQAQEPAERRACAATQGTSWWNCPCPQTSLKGPKWLGKSEENEPAISYLGISSQANLHVQHSFLQINSVFWLKTMINLGVQQKKKLMF